MSHPTEALTQASVRQHCKTVRTPAIAANFIPLAEQAIKEQHSHVCYLEALLAMECEERDRHAIANRIRDAQLPRVKTLEEFDFGKAPQIPAAKIRHELAQGWLHRTERADRPNRRLRHRQKPLGNRPLLSGVPAKAARSVRHCRGPGE